MRGIWILVLLAAVLLSGCIGQQAPETPQVVILTEKPLLRAELVECAYDSYATEASNRYMFFFKVWNAGEPPTKVPSQICLSNSKSQRPNCIILSQQYHNGQVLWEDINWSDGRHGQQWFIEAPSAQRQDMNVKLYYTSNIYYTESPIEPINDTVIIYEGSTKDCKTVTH